MILTESMESMGTSPTIKNERYIRYMAERINHYALITDRKLTEINSAIGKMEGEIAEIKEMLVNLSEEE